MQVYNNSNSIGLKTLLLFVVVLIIACLPVSSFLYFIKNDAFNGYFPPRFFMSESIHAGYLPLWNPYINFGFPQYGDMSGGYWSPFTWLIASVTGYNAYIFTVEILMYILIGGLGIYKLTSAWCSNRFVCCIAGISFMCCGFNTGHLQHVNWLSGIGFLAWCIYFFLRLQKKITLSNILVAVLFFYLFISAAHPSLIIASFYFFIALLVFTYFKNECNEGWNVKAAPFIMANLLLAVILLLVSTGMIISYLDIIPHFVRGQKPTLHSSVEHITAISSWVSVLLPFSTVKNEALLFTDLSMRNNYMGLVVLLFLLAGMFGKKTRWQWFLLITGIIFLLLSTGGIFKTAAYYVLPMMSYVRLNGIYSGITIICFILFAAIELNKYAQHNKPYKSLFEIIYYSLAAILLFCIGFGISTAYQSGISIFYKWEKIKAAPQFAKAIVDNISFYDTLWMQGIIQLVLLSLVISTFKKKRYRALLYICAADMVIASLLNIPFTGAGKASLSDVQHILNKSPKAIPIPALIPITEADTLTEASNGLTGHWSMYSKQLGVMHEVPYPITLNNARNYFESAMLYSHRPFLFVPDSIETTMPIITSYSPNRITFNIVTTKPSEIILQQNYYPNWYYDIGKGETLIAEKDYFLHVPLVKGANHITLFFDPKKIKVGMLISLVSFCLLMIAIVLLNRKKVDSLIC
ncbi:MAG TPA: hypothetical protein VK498_02180 [Ferruginibacter sp.]|nr:hypothetical protein [Ferruginibacter sp.]